MEQFYLDNSKVTEIRILLDSFSNKRVLVIGDLMADKFIYGETIRLSREAPVPVLHIEKEDYKLGAAANVARCLKLFGAEVSLCGIVGYDDAADSLQRQLNKKGIGTGGIIRSVQRPTTLKIRVIATPYSQQLLRIDRESTERLTKEEFASILSITKAFLPETDVLLIADYDKGLFKGKELSQALMDEAIRFNVPIVVDTKSHHFKYFSRATLVIAPYSSALQYYEQYFDREIPSINNFGQLLFEQFNPHALLLNRAEKGLALFSKNDDPYLIGGLPESSYNYYGLEDALSATMALSLACGTENHLAVDISWLAIRCILKNYGLHEVSQDDISKQLQELIQYLNIKTESHIS